MGEVEVSVPALSHTLTLLDVPKPWKRARGSKVKSSPLRTLYTCEHMLDVAALFILLSIQWMRGVTELSGELQCRTAGFPSSTVFFSFFSFCIAGVSGKQGVSDFKCGGLWKIGGLILIGVDQRKILVITSAASATGLYL